MVFTYNYIDIVFIVFLWKGGGGGDFRKNHNPLYQEFNKLLFILFLTAEKVTHIIQHTSPIYIDDTTVN